MYVEMLLGRKYWIFDRNHPTPGFSREGRAITELGIPDDIDHIDAAFVWGYNQKTYFISGDMYWRYNEDTSSVEDDYPRDMSMWSAVPVPVSAAFQYWGGRSSLLGITPGGGGGALNVLPVYHP